MSKHTYLKPYKKEEIKDKKEIVKYLKECFIYNKETGDIVWASRPRSHFSSKMAFSRAKTLFEGKKAGYLKPDYKSKHYTSLVIRIGERDIQGARIAWAIYYGEWPEREKHIDHIDGNPENNRIENLRLVTQKENNKNRKLHRNNKTGLHGVS